MDAPPSSAQEGLDTARQAAMRHSGPATVMMAFVGISSGLCRGWKPVLGIQTLSSVSSQLLSGPIGWSLNLECITTPIYVPQRCCVCFVGKALKSVVSGREKGNGSGLRREAGRLLTALPLETEGEQSPAAFCS